MEILLLVAAAPSPSTLATGVGCVVSRRADSEGAGQLAEATLLIAGVLFLLQG